MHKKPMQHVLALLIVMCAVVITACSYAYYEDLGERVSYTFIEYSEEHREWTIEELGEIIVAAGMFWEEWWGLTGRFSFEFIDSDAWVRGDVPEHFPSAIHMPLLPSSGFNSLGDIRNYLYRYYTKEWVDDRLSVFSPFVEYDGVLYIAVARACSPRPDWETASHVMVSQSENHAAVETIVTYGTWDNLPFNPRAFEVAYRFYFVNGRITNMISDWPPHFSYYDEYCEWTIEELGEIIVAAGMFWEGFQSLDGRFSVEHHDIPARIRGEHPQHLGSYMGLLPSSGFENINDIREYLSQFYTQEWIDDILLNQFPPFVEHNGKLYMLGGVAGPGADARPDWNTASHVLVERSNEITIIETTVTHGSWHRVHPVYGGDAFPFEMTHHFTFVSGRIIRGPNAHNVAHRPFR